MYPVVVVLSGPESTRAKAELALEKAHLTIIPPTEWPVQRQSYKAEHWPHLTQLPSGQEPDEEHGFLAVLAETEAAFHAAYQCVEKAKWVLRVHHELPEKPKPNPTAVLFDDLMARLDRQEQRIAELTRKVGGYPSIGGAGFETNAGEFMQAASYSAAQTRRSVFGWAARTSANTPGLISGGVFSTTDMQLSNAVSGLVVYTSTGECLIPGTEATSQGGYHGFLSSQNSTTLATANGSNPRIDTICATSADAQYTIPSGGTSGYVTIQAVTGTPTSGANLTNLSGKAALPASSLLLGYVLVPASATSLTSGDILNESGIVIPQATSSFPSWPLTWTSWTPTLGALGGSPAWGNSTYTARYTKIGRVVQFYMDVSFGSTVNAGTGYNTISLPVAAATNADQWGTCKWTASAVNYQGVVWIAAAAPSVAEPFVPTSSSTSAIASAIIAGNGYTFSMWGTYESAS